MATNKKRNRRLQAFLVFPDIAYGVALGLALAGFQPALKAGSIPALILLVLTYFLICDNWWGSHFMAIRNPPTPALFVIEVLEVLNMVLMAHYAAERSPVFVILFATYGLFGLVWDLVHLGQVGTRGEHGRIVTTWSVWAAVLAVTYAAYYSVIRSSTTISLATSALVAGIWIVLRVALALISLRQRESERIL